MNRKPVWLKNYSMIFSLFIFAMLFAQLLVPGINLNSISGNYLWRNDLIKKYSYFKYQIGDRVFINAVIGKEGWLYFTGDMSIQDYQRTSSLNVGNLKRLTQILKKIQDQTEKYGGTFLLVTPPNKSTVYPQYMPEEIPVLGQTSGLDRLIEYLNNNSDIQVLDFRPVFSGVSRDTQIYYKIDTHWNCMGAFYAANEILLEVSNLYPQIQPYSLNDFKFYSRDSALDVSPILKMDIWEDSINAAPKFVTGLSAVPAKDYDIDSLKIKVSDHKDLPELMIFHDSFYGCLNTFLEPSFSRTMALHFKDLELEGYLDIIAAEKPNIVIVEFVERYIDFFYGHLSE